MDVAATAGGTMRAVDLVFNDIQPRNGVIDIRFIGGNAGMSLPGEAFVQALKSGRAAGDEGAVPVTVLGRNLLRNAGFEQWSCGRTRGRPPQELAIRGGRRVGGRSGSPWSSPMDDGEQFGAVAEGTVAARAAWAGPESPDAGGRCVSRAARTALRRSVGIRS